MGNEENGVLRLVCHVVVAVFVDVSSVDAELGRAAVL